LHLGHLAPKSVIFQKGWGVRQINSLHSLHVVTTIKEISRLYYINDVDPSLLFIVTPESVT
jgi:hypothetical protein